MDLDARRAQTRRTLKRVFWAWAVLANGAATLGGIAGLIGWLEIDNDRT